MLSRSLSTLPYPYPCKLFLPGTFVALNPSCLHRNPLHLLLLEGQIQLHHLHWPHQSPPVHKLEENGEGWGMPLSPALNIPCQPSPGWQLGGRKVTCKEPITQLLKAVLAGQQHSSSQAVGHALSGGHRSDIDATIFIMVAKLQLGSCYEIMVWLGSLPHEGLC